MEEGKWQCTGQNSDHREQEGPRERETDSGRGSRNAVENPKEKGKRIEKSAKQWANMDIF